MNPHLTAKHVVGAATGPVVVRFALAVVVVAFFFGLWLGHGWGSGSQVDRVDALSDQVIALSAERDTARNVAAGTPMQLPHCGPPSSGRQIRSWSSSALLSPNWMPVQTASLNSNAWRHSASRP